MSWGDPDPTEGHQVEAEAPSETGVVASGLALLLGIGSILMSGLLVAHFAFLVVEFGYLRDANAMQGPSWRTLLFQVTSRWWITGLSWWVGIAWALGYTGRRMALASPKPDRRGSLAQTAARFSAWGLIGCAIDLAILAGMLAYRWTR